MYPELTVKGPGGDQTLSGTTGKGKKNRGIYSTEWMGNLVEGAYIAEVTSLTHDSFGWNQALDPTGNDTDLDADNQPDPPHKITH